MFKDFGGRPSVKATTLRAYKRSEVHGHFTIESHITSTHRSRGKSVQEE